MATRLRIRIRRGETCLGRRIFLPKTDRQNWERKAAAALSAQIKWALERQSYDKKILGEAIKCLHRNLSNPIHYGDSKPGWTFGDIPGNPRPGTLVVPDARFNYFDLFSFGISGEYGYEGFLRDCGLPSSVPYIVVVAATCLLLIDDAVDAMDCSDPWYASWALYQAHDLLGDLLSGESAEEAIAKRQRENASRGGKATGAQKRAKALTKPMIEEAADRLRAKGTRPTNKILAKEFGGRHPDSIRRTRKRT
jgi:hypothetical protein